jgi:hypothetical protein
MAFRVLAGTALYVIIVVLAAPFPRAAGLMLVFPALNGLSFVFAERDSVAGMARSMYWMPVLNGALCAGYIVAFLMFADLLPPALLSWLMFAIVVVLWLGLASGKRIAEGIAPAHQLAYAIAATLIGLALVAIASVIVARAHGAPGVPSAMADGWSAEHAWGAVWANRMKIALFVLCLSGFLAVTTYLRISDARRGILAGIPIVPFAGLLSVAADAGTGMAERLQIIGRMGVTVWLGPAVAIWFIYGFSRFLDARTSPHATARDTMAKWSALVAGWGLCGVAIAAIARTVGP